MPRPPCFECKNESDHDHHVIPKSIGGVSTVPLCESCHKKAHELRERSGSKSFSELVRLGMQKARDSGAKLGRPRKIEGKRALVKELLDKGHNKRAISEILGVSISTVRRTAKRY